MNLSQTRKEKRKTQKRVKASQSAGNEENGVLKSTCEKLLNSMNSKKKKKTMKLIKKKKIRTVKQTTQMPKIKASDTRRR